MYCSILSRDERRRHQQRGPIADFYNRHPIAPAIAPSMTTALVSNLPRTRRRLPSRRRAPAPSTSARSVMR